jgi:glyoxylase-like metal-dependent hydrolase (beta-lactamase superfamily II)
MKNLASRMCVTVVALLALLALSGAGVAPQDARALLADAARALGVDTLKTVQYSGTGYAYAFGQNYRPDAPYPKFHASYSRAIDYAQRLSREQTVRRQFENPPRGGGGQPLYREASATAVSSDASPWGGGAVLLTPHGFVAAALAGSPTIGPARGVGGTVTRVSFTSPRGFAVTGDINAQNLVERVETRVANPILGDSPIETTYTGYRAFGGVQFPTRIVQRQGGFPTLEITVAEVQPNVPVTIAAPPAASPQPVRAEGVSVAPGVWYLAGAPDPNSQLVEFRDYAVIVESSVSEARALANIAEARRLLPDKPIRYHVNSHHHGDHAAGLRAFVAQGTTIITHEMNRRFYEQTVLRNPHTIAPDALSKSPRAATFVWVGDKFVLTDGARTMEIYHVRNGHAANLLMSYLPQERLLMITDIFNDFGMPRPNDPPPGIVTPYYAALGERVRGLKLAIDRVAPSHGREVLEGARLWKALEGRVQAPAVQP